MLIWNLWLRARPSVIQNVVFSRRFVKVWKNDLSGLRNITVWDWLFSFSVTRNNLSAGAPVVVAAILHCPP